jgi:hypothetical protein
LARQETGDDGLATVKEATLTMARYELIGKFSPAVYILASALPIWAATPVAQALAGRQTSFILSISVTLAISVALALGNAVQWFKNRGQGRELVRLRIRVSNLEGQLAVMKGKSV